jgi:hypothetical protein
MPDIILHNIPDHIFALHLQQAEQEGVDIEQHIQRILAQKLPSKRLETITQIEALRREIKTEYGVLDDSTPLIREFRDTL